MDKQQARDIVRDTLGKPFAKEAFTRLVKELFNQIDEAKAFHARGYVPESYKKYVKTYERIATYTDPNSLKIDILIVYLQSETTLERARTSQRNFIAHYLKDRDQKDAGLVAFVSPDPSDWRFSLVKMDYRFAEGKDGKVKVKEEFTPARRWSFLVGTNENSHTAQSRLAPLITDDTHNPALADLEEAFNIESVTKEFFTEYRNLFLRVKEALDAIVTRDANIKNNFEQNGVNTVDFAKKLLGQIVFLYFLQKKGWFGVERDAQWGTGSKQFLRELFKKMHGNYKNFFNDILEPLFYDALSRDRSDIDHWNDHFKCKIPFLNGGLFDPMNNYDWVHSDILIPNEFFSNAKTTKEGDTGDGILDVFDRYNFTVKEDEPLEKEVAIDPELLGKAYEKFNAIRPDNFDEFQKALKSGKKGEESKFNKQFGVYYTPREIVHYMCQQSLINYLFSQFNGGMVTYEKPGVRQTDLLGNTGKKGQLDLTIEHKERPAIPKEDIEKLIHYGEHLSDNEAIAIIKEENINAGKQKTAKTKSLLPDSIPNNAVEIDRKLAGIKVCDPAIGSGAFPVGMMSEIVRARNTLSTFIKNTNRSIYHFKRDCIENSLYGVDIDSGAVEIAKLRLWLSLVVDEDDIRQIKPLPNLDYKIVCGNSLLGLPADILPDVAISKEIEEKKKQYFSTTSPSEKNKIRETINSLFSQLMENIKKYDPTIADINFDFHTHFSEVFHANGGFDIVIANPPYVGEKGHKEMFREIRKGSLMKFYQRKMDLFYFFFHLAINLGKQDSIIAFITTNYYPTATGGKKLRGDFKGRAIISRLINLNELKIFESALGQHNMITILQKRSNENAIANTCITKRKGDTKPEILQAIVDWKDAGTDYFQIAQKDLYDGAECYIRLAGSAKISNNPTQILLEKVKSKADPLIIFCHVNMGVQSGADAIGKKLLKRALDQNYTNKNYLLKNQINIGDKIYIIDRLFLNKLPLSERSIIKPFIKNSEIKDYFIPYAYNQYYIYADSKVDINEFPTIKQHLLKFRPILNAREQVGDSEDSWYWIRGSKREFLINTGPHIVCPYRSKKNIFALTDGNIIGAGDIYYITKKDLSVSLNYILALLNSKLYYLWLYHRGKRKGEILELYQQPLSEIPIKKGSESEQKPFIEIVDKILAITKSNDYLQNPIKQAKVKEYEEEIDQMVYKLYGLTEDEIKIVEGEK